MPTPPKSRTSKSRKPLFIFMLAALGFAAAGLAAAALILLGLIHFAWSDALLRRWSDSEARAKPLRVLAIGDSFLSWWPIDHDLHKSLRDYAEERDLGMVIAAAGGFGPYEYLDQARRRAPDFKPGLVILFYYCGNDLTDVLYRSDETPRTPEGFDPFVRAPKDAAPRQGAINWGFSTAARAEDPEPPGFDWAAMRKHGIAESLIQKAQNRVRHPGEIGPEYVNPYVLQLALGSPRYLKEGLLIDSDAARAGWARGAAALKKLFKLARGLGADVRVVAIPSNAQLGRSHERFYRDAAFEWDDRFIGSTAPQDLLRELCDAEGVGLLDLMPAFRAEPDPGALFWENDEHLSEPGHKVAWREAREKILDPWAEAQRKKAEAAATPPRAR